MRYFPTFLDLRRRRCLVVGGGAQAARRARLMLKAQAAVTVVAEAPGEEIADLAAGGAVTLIRRGFAAADVAGHVVVLAADGEDADHRAVSAAARAAGIPVNVADRPQLSSFVMPAIVDRDPVVVAISTGGASPVLARALRARIEAVLPSRLGRLARFAASFRDAVKALVPYAAARRRLWERVLDGPVAEAVLRGDEPRAREKMLRLVNSGGAAQEGDGAVYIVGTGPGDPDLLTFRALRLMQQADVVIHDRLIGPDILDYVRRDADRIYVGKSKSNHTKTQDQINALMVRHARAGKRVLRLKGGDPFIFGRGGEEWEHLRRAGIEVEVVPGITAATGCAAAAGIPLTHRDFGRSMTFLSGHSKAGAPEPDWAALAGAGQTLVIYMGVSTAGVIARRLIEHGMDPATPAAIIENGTRPDEKRVLGSLMGLDRMVAEAAIDGPALILIGEAVRLGEDWREAQPARRAGASGIGRS
ncbi:MAG: siroheme synthase CysG [Kiloniellales bacterium]